MSAVVRISPKPFPLGDPRGVGREDFLQGLYGMPKLLELVNCMPVTTDTLRKLLPLQQQVQLEDKLKPRHVPHVPLDDTNDDEGLDQSQKQEPASIREVSALDVLKHLPGRRLQWGLVHKIISSDKNRVHSAEATTTTTATQLCEPDRYQRNRNPPSSTVYILQQCVVLPIPPSGEDFVDKDDSFECKAGQNILILVVL